jgi:hypothetical protein
MPPTPGDVHVNRPLTNISIAYLQGQTRFVSAEVFPVVPVQKQSDRYFVYDKGDLMRDEAKPRAPGTESAGMDYDIDNTPTYSCTKYALHKDVDDDTAANADAPLRPEQDAAEILTDKLLIKRDATFVANYFVTGVWDTDWDGVTGVPGANEFLQWQETGSDPIADIDNAKEAVSALTGFDPNVIVMGKAVFNAVKNHTAVIDRIKYTQRGIVTEEILAALFGVQKVVVPGAVSNTAAKGATDVIARLFGKHVLVAYRPERPAIMKPSAGYCFSWAGLYGAGNEGLRTKRFRMEHLNSMRIENEFAWDLKVVATDCAAFLEDAIA